MRISALLVAGAIAALHCSAQTQPLCGSGSVLDAQMAQWVEERIEQHTAEVMALRGGGPCPIWRIPVVFHVIADPGNPGSNIPDNFITDQLAHMNDEFLNNLDGQGDVPCMQFCLAQNTPDGAPWSAYGSTTAGITRWGDADATVTGINVVDMEELATLIHFPSAQYYNIWIVSDAGADGVGPGLIGAFGRFPVDDAPIDGVVIEFPWVTQPGIEGDLLIHETGHYLGLFHTFGGCVDPDNCPDTPGETVPAFSCIPPNSCGVPEQVENYMDYTPEPCQNTFTSCQVLRMQTQLVDWRASLVTEATGVITGILGPNGCAPTPVTAELAPYDTEFCVGVASGPFNGVVSADSWQFDFSNSGGSIPSVSGASSVPTTGMVTFPNGGPWVITLTVTIGGNTDTFTITIYASDCSPVQLSQAQWYFGAYCALDFSTGVPLPIDNSAMNTEDAPACVCDPGSGIMRFYASNRQAYNSGHVPLTPTYGPVTTYADQGAVLVPNIANPDQHYLFSTPDNNEGLSELRYSTLDISLLSGGFSGAFSTPDGPAVAGSPNITEHLGAVPSCEPGEYWIVTHGIDGANVDQLLSYRLTGAGVILPPVPSPSFMAGPGFWDRAGQVEINHKGTLAAITEFIGPGVGVCHIHSFDRQNGTFQFLFDLPAGTCNGWGASFSRSGDFLYTSTFTGIYQHDFRSFDPCLPLVPNNYTAFPELLFATDLQLGPDDKVYMTNDYRDNISVINYPEIWNVNPNDFGFNWQGVSVVVPGGTNETCRIGLPNMIDAEVAPPVPDFYACVDCHIADFTFVGCADPADIEWDVNCDGTIEGTGATYSVFFPVSGTYDVCMLIDGVVVAQHPVTIEVPPIPLVIPPNAACLNQPQVYTCTNCTGLNVTWDVSGPGTPPNPPTGNQTTVTWSGNGQLWITVVDPLTNCSTTVAYDIEPTIYEPNVPDQEICLDETATLTVPGGFNCVWNPTVNLDLSDPCAPVFTPPSVGGYPYSVTAEDANGCVGTTDVIVQVSACEFTVTKTVSSPNTYAGAPVLYTITVCNYTSDDQNVTLTDLGITSTDFTVTSMSSAWLGFPDDPLTLFLLAGECMTWEIAGFFTEMGDYTNCVEADPELVEDMVSACAEEVTVWQNCPLVVSGSGDCVTGPVHMCMGSTPTSRTSERSTSSGSSPASLIHPPISQGRRVPHRSPGPVPSAPSNLGRACRRTTATWTYTWCSARPW